MMISIAYADEITWKNVSMGDIESVRFVIIPYKDKRYELTRDEIAELLKIAASGSYNKLGHRPRIQPYNGCPVFSLKTKSGKYLSINMLTVFHEYGGFTGFTLPEHQKAPIYELIDKIINRSKSQK